MNYDFKKVAVLCNGIQITGFMDGTGISVEPSDDDFKPHVGVDGRHSRARNNGVYEICTLSLAQTSASNDVLSALSLADRNTGIGVFAMSITDTIGTTLHVSASAYIQKRPTTEEGDELSGRDWVIIMPPDGESFVGGNNNLDGS